MRIVRLTFVAAAAALCACASVPMAKPEHDVAAKRFDVPPDQAVLYVFRDESLGGAVKLTVLVDGQHVGDNAPHTFLLVPVAAGRHQITSKAEVDATLDVAAERGRAYFVWQEVKMGIFSARTALHLMSDQEGKARVGTCALAEPPPGSRFPIPSLDPAGAQSATAAVATAEAPAKPAFTSAASESSAATPASAVAEGFPRVLSGAQIAEHFGRHSSVDATLGRQTFKLTVQANSVERHCPGCRVVYGAGDARIDGDRICFQWTRVTFPDSGCYQVVQTAADQFTLRGVDQQRPMSYSARD